MQALDAAPWSQKQRTHSRKGQQEAPSPAWFTSEDSPTLLPSPVGKHAGESWACGWPWGFPPMESSFLA